MSSGQRTVGPNKQIGGHYQFDRKQKERTFALDQCTSATSSKRIRQLSPSSSFRRKRQRRRRASTKRFASWKSTCRDTKSPCRNGPPESQGRCRRRLHRHPTFLR